MNILDNNNHHCRSMLQLCGGLTTMKPIIANNTDSEVIETSASLKNESRESQITSNESIEEEDSAKSIKK